MDVVISHWGVLKEKLANKILITTGDADNWAAEKSAMNRGGICIRRSEVARRPCTKIERIE
jgi:hypothetical protein